MTNTDPTIPSATSGLDPEAEAQAQLTDKSNPISNGGIEGEEDEGEESDEYDLEDEDDEDSEDEESLGSMEGDIAFQVEAPQVVESEVGGVEIAFRLDAPLSSPSSASGVHDAITAYASPSVAYPPGA